MECSKKDLLPPFNAIIRIEMQRESKGCLDYWINFAPGHHFQVTSITFASIAFKEVPPLPSTPPCIISGSLIPTSHSDPTILDHQSSQSQILAILVIFGHSWAKIWDNPAFPTQAKPQPGRPVTRSNFIPGCSNCYQSARSQILAIFGTF